MYLISLSLELAQYAIEDLIPTLERFLEVPVRGLSSNYIASICTRVKGSHEAREEWLKELDE